MTYMKDATLRACLSEKPRGGEELRDCQTRDGVNGSLSDETGANRDESPWSNLRRVKRLNPILAAMGNRVREDRVPSKELRSDA
jgi:hypothetical protein